MRSHIVRAALAVLASTIIVGTLTASSVGASTSGCPSQTDLVKRLSRQAGVPVPSLTPSKDHRSFYHLPSRTITLARCASESTIAHEFGHYVGHLAAGWDWNVFTELSSSFTVKSNWLTTSDDAGGWERAAHCVGYILGIRGTYTRCPEPSLRASAREVVRIATVVAFGGQ